MREQKTYQFGRRPKGDILDDWDANEEDRYNLEEEEHDDEDENEEINLDNPDFKKGEMWSDYAEDMDFEE
jgi:hypothetical protein